MTPKLYARREDVERAIADGDAAIYVCTEKPFGNWLEISYSLDATTESEADKEKATKSIIPSLNVGHEFLRDD